MANSASISPVSASADRKSLLLGISWPVISIATVFVAARFYCRIKLMRKVWWDDYMILLSLVCGLATVIFWTIYANKGGCRHSAILTIPQLVEVARLNWISQPFAIASLITGKLSVACLLFRLQSPAKWRIYILFVVSIVGIVMCVIAIILIFAQCTPITLLWNPFARTKGHCWNPNVVTFYAQVVGGYLGFMDIVLATIPVQMIWNLKMNKRKKIATCIFLSTGWIAFVFDIIKTVELEAESTREDRTWDTVWLLIWNAFEISIVILAACIPALIPLFEIITSKRSASHFAKKTNYPTKSFPLRRVGHSNRYEKSKDSEAGIDILTSEESPREFRNNTTEENKNGESRTREWSMIEAQ